ncbi:MAG: hypothetical protein ACRCZF_07105, partial [Gemmataceae bacterium]
KPVTLRYEREGNIVRASYSFDEKSWMKFDDLEAELPEKLSVGVYVAHNFDKGLEVQFEPLLTQKFIGKSAK